MPNEQDELAVLATQALTAFELVPEVQVYGNREGWMLKTQAPENLRNVVENIHNIHGYDFWPDRYRMLFIVSALEIIENKPSDLDNANQEISDSMDDTDIIEWLNSRCARYRYLTFAAQWFVNQDQHDYQTLLGRAEFLERKDTYNEVLSALRLWNQ